MILRSRTDEALFADFICKRALPRPLRRLKCCLKKCHSCPRVILKSVCLKKCKFRCLAKRKCCRVHTFNTTPRIHSPLFYEDICAFIDAIFVSRLFFFPPEKLKLLLSVFVRLAIRRAFEIKQWRLCTLLYKTGVITLIFSAKKHYCF